MTAPKAATSGAAPGHMKQPPALYLLFFVEMWERLSYYGMRFLLVLYLTAATTAGGLGWTEADALSLYGTYTGLVYLSPLLGGWLGDRFLGIRKAVTLGATIMMIGHISMAFEGVTALYIGLACLIIGNGFFKPCMGQLVGSLFSENDPRKDGAYTIFYVGVNVGALLAGLVCAPIGEKFGFHYGFGLAAIGMAAGQIMYLTLGKKFLGDIGLTPANKRLAIVDTKSDEKQKKIQFDKYTVIAVLAVFTIVFWASFEQAGGLMTLYTDQKVDRMLFGWEVPTTMFQSLNPAFIIIFGPIFAWMWTRLGEKKLNPAAPMKFAYSLVLMGLGFVFMVIAAKESAATGKAAMTWIVLSYLFQTWGELCLSPVGLAMVNKLSPVNKGALMMGIWYLAIAVANKLSGTIGGYASVLGEVSLFGAIAGTAIASGILLVVLSPMLKKRMHGIT